MSVLISKAKQIKDIAIVKTKADILPIFQSYIVFKSRHCKISFRKFVKKALDLAIRDSTCSNSRTDPICHRHFKYILIDKNVRKIKYLSFSMRIYIWTWNLVYFSKKQIAYALVKHVEQKKNMSKSCTACVSEKK